MTSHPIVREPRFETDVWVDTSDESLLESIAEGSEDALRELIRRHRRSVRSVVTRVVSCSADAEEVVQDVFLTTLEVCWNVSRAGQGNDVDPHDRAERRRVAASSRSPDALNDGPRCSSR